MAEFRVTQLKHPIRYDDYIVMQRDDGHFVAESRHESETIEIVAFDLAELFAALDTIEDAANGHSEEQMPAWLSLFLEGESDRILLPSAVPIAADLLPRPVAPAPFLLETTAAAAWGRRDGPGPNDYTITVRDIYHFMPSQIARQFSANAAA